MIVYYGIENIEIDVTDIFIKNFIINNSIRIPSNTKFNYFFGDPVPNILKKIFINIPNMDEIVIQECDSDITIQLPPEKNTLIHPISFSIPECKIVDKVSDKTRDVAHIIPGKLDTYIYNTEQSYYDGYKESWFGITCKKGGWDCLRHLEILANGCIPLFKDIEKCPDTILTHLPKKLLSEINNKFNNASISNDDKLNYANTLLKYTRDNLTTKVMAKNVLDTSNNVHATKILFLSGENWALSADYLRCLTLHGFKDLFKDNCHDYPCVKHLYSGLDTYGYLYGKGFTVSGNLNRDECRNEDLDSSIEADIESHYYDVVIYGSVHRGTPFLRKVRKHYKPNEIIYMCGEDEHECSYKTFSSSGSHVFIRELIE